MTEVYYALAPAPPAYEESPAGVSSSSPGWYTTTSSVSTTAAGGYIPSGGGGQQNSALASTISRLCAICGAPSNGYHFNAPSCSACAAFFRRTVTLDRRFSCPHHNNCRVNYAMRVICRACRYAKCIAHGMDRKAVQPRRDCNAGRRKINYTTIPNGQPLQTQQQQQVQQMAPLHVHLPSATLSHQSLLVPKREASSYLAATDTSPPPPAYCQQQQQLQQQYTLLQPLQVVAAPGNIITSAMLSTELLSPPSDEQPPHYASSYASSSGIDNEQHVIMSSSPAGSLPNSTYSSLSIQPPDILEELLAEERRLNERRRVLFSSTVTISSMLGRRGNPNDISFTKEDLRELNLEGIARESRSMILLVYEWSRAVPGYTALTSRDKKAYLCRAVLHQVLLDSTYLTYRLGYPDRFIMLNGMYVGIPEYSTEGWGDEPDFITGELKKSLYRPLLDRAVNQIVRPMHDIAITFTEFVALKALVSWKSTTGLADFTPAAKESMQTHIDALFAALSAHYSAAGIDASERIGAVVLLMSSFVDIGMEILESHHKIHLFELWELDSLLLQFLCAHSEI